LKIYLYLSSKQKNIVLKFKDFRRWKSY